MLQTLMLYWEILWRRRLPSDLPYSPALCLATALVSIALGIGVNEAFARFVQVDTAKLEPGAPSFVIVPFVVALGAAGYALVLRAFRHTPRVLQTLNAILGISLFTGAAGLLLLLAGLALPTSMLSLRGLIGFAVIAVSIYDLYLKCWILGQALERPVALSFLIVLSLEIFTVLVASLLLGPRTAGA